MSTPVLNDSAVAAWSVEYDDSLAYKKHIYAAGTLRYSATDTVFSVLRYPFQGSPTTNQSPEIVTLWPVAGLPHADALRTLKSAAWWPQTSVPIPGGNMLFVAGRIPSDDAGHWNLQVIGYDGNLNMLWSREEPTSVGDAPILIATDGGDVVVAMGADNAISPTSGQDFIIYDFVAVTGKARWKSAWSSPGNHADTIVGLALSGSGGAVVTGTGYSATEGCDKIVTQLYDLATGTRLRDFAPPGLNDGRNYTAAGLCMARSGAGTSPYIAVTGSVTQQGSNDVPPPKNYITAGYVLDQDVPRWSHEYDGPAHLDDQAAAVNAVFFVEQGDGDLNHMFTCVTGKSVGLASGNYDLFSILYNWDPNPAPFGSLSINWKARWDRPNVGLYDLGLAIDHDPFITDTTGQHRHPYYYILGKTQNAAGNYDYIHLSYNKIPEPGESKLTRWEPDAPDGRYYTGPSGDDVPAWITVHLYDTLKYFMSTGRSLGVGTGDDMLTTLNQDTTP